MIASLGVSSDNAIRKGKREFQAMQTARDGSIMRNFLQRDGIDEALCW